jgi:RNA polymerase sigma factor (sigma-70 family)
MSREHDMAGGDELRELVRRAAAGDQGAWSVLHRRFDGLVRHVVRDFGLDAAASEELVQATWCRLVEHIGLLRRPECITGWLGRTARNECLQALRRSARELPTEGETLEALAGGEDDPEYSGDDRQLAVRVARAYGALHDDQQTLVRLVLLTEPKPSYEQIGAMLGRPVGSIGPTFGRCVDKLRLALAA